MTTTIKPLLFLTDQALGPDRAEHLGFRFGAIGTHTSRTMMLEELTLLLEAQPADTRREKYAQAIIEENILGKATTATRRLSNQRLGELYGLDPSVAIFRVMRGLWDIDSSARPLLALLVAIARDPLLAASADAIIGLSLGAEYSRDQLRGALRQSVGERLSDSTVDKVARNVASTWTQSGHLTGRTFKRRALASASPVSAAMALYLASAAGFRSEAVLASAWCQVLDLNPSNARRLAVEAKALGLIDLRAAGDVLVLDVERLDPYKGRR